MRLVNVVAIFLFPIAVWGQEPDFTKLGAEDFKVRMEGQKEMDVWVLQRREGAKEVLLNEYLRSPDPEVRARLLPLLERAYFPSRGYVGVVMRPIFPEVPRQGLADRRMIYEGVVITRVAEGTPAEKSGLKVGDVIRKVNEWRVEGGQDITGEVAREIQKHPPGSPVSLTVFRDGEEVLVELQLGVLPVPSERIRSLREDQTGGFFIIPVELREEVKEFQGWLEREIAKDSKKLVAD